MSLPAVPSPRTGGQARVLVVHEDPRISEALTDILLAAGYEVIQAQILTDGAPERLCAVDCAISSAELVPTVHRWFEEDAGDRVALNLAPTLVVSAAFAAPSGRLPRFYPEVRAYIPWPVEPERLLSHVESAVASIRRERRLQRLVEDVFPLTGPKFFAAAARFLGEELAADACIIAELVPNNTEQVRTLAYWRSGQLEENFEYELAGTPCENVVGKSFCLYRNGVAELFPRDQWLSTEGVRAYMGEPMFGAEGQPVGLVNATFRRPLDRATQEDATLFRLIANRAAAELERERAVTSLRRSEERFRHLTEYAPDMIHVIDNQGTLLFQSPSGAQILGYSDEERVGKSVFELIHPEDVDRAATALRRAVARPGEVVSVEYRLRHKDGSWRILQSVGRSLPEVSPQGFIVINSRDVTESRRLQEQFLQAQKMEAVGRLAGGVAHDFNNLLTVILGNAQLWESAAELPPDAREAFREIRHTAERAATLTRQLLAFSRRQLMQPRPLDLNERVTGLVQMLRRIIGEDIDLILDLHRDPLWIRADPVMLEQVLLNLAVNARDAMPQGGTLRIETGVVEFSESEGGPDKLSEGAYACLRMADTGSGIAPEHLPKIFEPFFTTKETGKGTGLGLATVYGVVKQHRGAVRVRSAVGEGTVFEILLPVYCGEEISENEQLSPPTTTRGGSERVLVVEDDPHVRSTVRSILERSGYRVLVASNGAEAQALWKDQGGEIDLVITDLLMPGGMTGLELAEHLRRDCPGLKVLYVSGYSSEFGGRRIELQAGEHFLHKPFTLYSLLQAVRSALAG